MFLQLLFQDSCFWNNLCNYPIFIPEKLTDNAGILKLLIVYWNKRRSRSCFIPVFWKKKIILTKL